MATLSLAFNLWLACVAVYNTSTSGGPSLNVVSLTCTPVAPGIATSVPPSATSVPPSATSVPPSATSVPPSATSVPPSATSVPPSATSAALPRFSAALAQSSSKLVRVAVIGDSIAYGLYASAPAPVPTSTSWPGIVRAGLQASYGDGGTGFVSSAASPDDSAGAYPSGSWPVNHYGSNWTIQQASSSTAYQSINAFAMTTQHPGDYITFAVRGSSIVVWYVSAPGGATFSVQIDGTTVASAVNSAAGAAASNSTLFAGLAGGAHLVTITHTGAAGSAATIMGVDAVNGRGVVVDLYAQSGQSLTGFVAAHGAVATAGAAARQASLLILALGVNDASGGVSATAAQAAFQTLTAAFSGVDTVYVYSSYGALNNPDLYTSYQSFIAPAVNVFVDSWTLDTHRSYQYGLSICYWGFYGQPGACNNAGADNIHPSDSGHALIARDVLAALLPSTPSGAAAATATTATASATSARAGVGLSSSARPPASSSATTSSTGSALPAPLPTSTPSPPTSTLAPPPTSTPSSPPTSTAFLLDQLTLKPTLAVSTRRLAAGAARCMRVLRSSDQTTQDIGFAANGWVDEAALLAFVLVGGSQPGAVGTVDLWYDQTGNGNHFASTGWAPVIVQNGQVQSYTGLPALGYSGVELTLQSGAPMKVAAAAAIVNKDPAPTLWSLFDGYNWFGGAGHDGTYDAVVDQFNCDPDVCGSGSYGWSEGVDYAPMGNVAHFPYTLNALGVATAKPQGNTAFTTIGHNAQGFNTGYYLELLVWNASAPVGADKAALVASERAVTNLSQWCVGLPDATNCLNQQFARWSGRALVAPLPSLYYPVSTVVGLAADTSLDARNATFYLTGTVPRLPSDFILSMSGNSSLTNATLLAAVPIWGLNIDGYGAGYNISYLTITGAGVAIMVGPNTTEILVHDCYITQSGYGVLVNEPYVSELTVFHNWFFNNSGDAVCINSPVGSTQTTATFSTAAVARNVYVLNNTMRAIRNDENGGVGFCVSSAGGQYIYIVGNDMSGCSWQGVHLEDFTNNVFIISNRIDNVYGNTAVAWAQTLDGIWMAQSMEVLVHNNTFSRITSVAVDVALEGKFCTANQQVTNAVIPIPPFYQSNHDINITGNTFEGWGLDGGAHSFAVRVGTSPGAQDAVQRLSGNSYNASLGGFVWCWCANGDTQLNVVDQDAQMVATDSLCTGYLYSEQTCAVPTTVC